jgi:chaperonin GroEL
MPRPSVVLPPVSAAYLKQGFDTLANLLAITLGPTQGVILNDSKNRNEPQLLQDAATAARRIIALPDRRQDVGAMLLRHLVWQVHEQVGDGSATTAVLAQALLHEGSKMVAAGANAVLVLNGMRQGVAKAVAALQAMAQPVTSQEELAAVAQAVTGEADLSWVIGEMVSLLGLQGHITVENYVAPYLERAYLEGGHWPGQLASPYLVTAQATQRAIQQDCWVALYDGQPKGAEQVAPLLQLVAEQERPNLLFVAHAMGREVVNLLVGTHQHPKNKLKVVATSIKLGGVSGQAELNDLARLTGATLLGEMVGRSLDSVTLADLGRAKRVESDKNGLYVAQGGGDKRAIRDEVEALQAQLAAMEGGDEASDGLQKRLARLAGSAGVLKIGARTKAERQVLYRKAEQGVKAARAALEEGVLPGGGIAFVWAAREIEVDTAVNDDERMGLIATKKALEAPFYRIFQNAQKPAAAVALHDCLAAGEGYVYDVLHEVIQPAQAAGVIDAAKVLRWALETAASGAEMALSVDVTVLKKRPVTNVGYEP